MSASWPINKKYFSQEGPDTLYIRFTPYMIDQQSTTNASAAGIQKSTVGTPLEFLMPSSFTYTINHEWENVDQLGTRFVQKFHKIEKSAEDITGVITGGSVSGNVITKKLDTPITFKDSNRRTLNITVQLADQGDTMGDVFYPVRLLERWSCSEKGAGNKFELPYIFTVETIGSSLVYMENAALMSVQPTYFGPYRGKYPSKCELTLDFRDIEPLYRKSFDRAGSYAM